MKRTLLITGLLLCQFYGYSQNWQSVGSSFSGPVSFLYCDTVNSSLIALGPFLSADTSTCYGIAKWDGGQWVAHLSSTGNYPRSITNFQGDYYITGTSTDGLFKWTGSAWTEIGPVDNGMSFVASVFNDGDSVLYALGRFDSLGGIAASGIAKYDGTTWSRVGTTNFLGTITCAIRFQGKLYVGGNFQDTNVSLENIACWDGSNWSAVGSGINGSLETVNTFAIFNNELLVGGYFRLSTGDPGEYIARWDGTMWTQVGGGVANGQVLTMVIYNNVVWVGGQFDTAGGISSYYLARWDGTDWCSISVFDNIIPTIATDGNNLYVGGNFTTVDSAPVNKVVWWIGGNFSDTCGHLNTGSTEVVERSAVQVFPNPASTMVTFQLGQNTNPRTIIITDQLGREIWRKETSETTIEFPASEFSAGMYFYSIEEREEIIATGKLIISD